MKTIDPTSTASQFINNTNVHVFLTGKAGTGKTTFLRNLSKNTHKTHLIVAPTGIAALNANGVTIHSQFLLPLGAFLPTDQSQIELDGSAAFYTRKTLVRKNALNKVRKQVLRGIDLLVIDEVSMLRADVLDAIDFRLRHARGNFNVPFGGVQLLLIGDLHQLPPIVRKNELDELRKFYDNMWFFESAALKQAGFAYVELHNIYRQHDDRFINILNNLRNNETTIEDIEILNAQFIGQKGRESLKGVIHLTTHKRKADERNRQELARIKGKKYSYKAKVNRDFPESMFPVEESISLKVGAQIMFIKNDTRNQDYFNGKLAIVTYLDDDEIRVKMEGKKLEYTLRLETWENKKYNIDEETKRVEEEVVGEYIQYPIKLAWSITVHKSQGLTFDRAIIDVEGAFVAGQVYVALSRLKSLEGVVLSSKINPDVISSDSTVVQFGHKRDSQKPLELQLEAGRKEFAINAVVSAFEFKPIIDLILSVSKGKESSFEFEDEEMRTALPTIREKLENQVKNTLVFQDQLKSLIRADNQGLLLTRLNKGCVYFNAIFEELLRAILTHILEVSQFSRVKGYLNALEEIDVTIYNKILEIRTIEAKVQAIVSGAEVQKQMLAEDALKLFRTKLIEDIDKHVSKNEKFIKLKTGKRKKNKPSKPKIKTKTGETYRVTKSLIDEGLTIDQVAEKRGMAVSTIESHIARLIGSKELPLERFVAKPDSKIIAKELASQNDGSLSQAYQALDGKYSYGKLRMVQALIRAAPL